MRLRRLLNAVALVLALAVVWWFILPPSLGGRTTLFVTRGVSMEPYIHQGDLALLHTKPRYEVGDVIAYKAKSINAISLHRIVAVNSNGTYSVKGDNNPERDLDKPGESEIYGKLDHLFPGKGHLVKVLTATPVRLAGLLLIVWALWGTFFGRRRKDTTAKRGGWRDRANVLGALRSRGPGQSPAGAEPAPLVSSTPPVGEPPDLSNSGPRSGSPLGTFSIAIMAFAVIAIAASVLLTGSAFTRPATSGNERKIMYTMAGKYTYTGPSAPGGELIYEGGKVHNGDPIYFSLVDGLDVGFDYSFSTMGDFKGSGTFSTSTVLKGNSGWRHTVATTEAQPFDGKNLHTDATLDLDRLRDITRQVQELTKVGEGGFNVAIEVTIKLDGYLSGEPFQETFPVTLNFSADSNILKTMASTVDPSAVSQPGSDDEKPAVLDGLNPTKSNTLTIPAGTPNKVTVAGHDTNVANLRTMGFIGLLIGFALLWLGANLRARQSNDDEEQISVEALQHYFAAMTDKHAESDAETRFRVRPTDSANVPSEKEEQP